MNSAELKELRLSVKMTQAEMAYMLGVPVVTYETWERRSVGKTASRFLDLLRYPQNRVLMMKMALNESRIKSEAGFEEEWKPRGIRKKVIVKWP